MQATNAEGHQRGRPPTRKATNAEGHQRGRPPTREATNAGGHQRGRPPTREATNAGRSLTWEAAKNHQTVGLQDIVYAYLAGRNIGKNWCGGGSSPSSD
ncbi:hypothetical protein N7539_008772 [Penicillium diatomitis]|uniref:Uncharacterized protein n=1 Tax=Penicillium diatomitis TaxID=2819901 RepID=A0A9W9WQM2_9EURO|nr:uncharacterized protein N7539_008772 [Penicillium diatomitis]KAJ5471829.1 hypothetical protein N7539_008772 [Penicillium diatomitis]